MAGALAGAQTGYLIGRRVGPCVARPAGPAASAATPSAGLALALDRYGTAKAIVLGAVHPLGSHRRSTPWPGRWACRLGRSPSGRSSADSCGHSGSPSAGYLLGKQIPDVDRYLLPIIAVIVAVSLIPVAVEVGRTRREHASVSGKLPPVSQLLDNLLGVPAWVVLCVVGLLVFSEDAVFVGFVLPGETAAVLGGAAAKLGTCPCRQYWSSSRRPRSSGTPSGTRSAATTAPGFCSCGSWGTRRAARAARAFLAHGGGPAVFLGRWVAFFRAVMPALAGTAHRRHPTFLAFNAAGGIAWAVVVVLAGYLAGASYGRVEKTFGRGSAIVALAVVLVALVAWRLRRRNRETNPR